VEIYRISTTKMNADSSAIFCLAIIAIPQDIPGKMNGGKACGQVYNIPRPIRIMAKGIMPWHGAKISKANLRLESPASCALAKILTS